MKRFINKDDLKQLELEQTKHILDFTKKYTVGKMMVSSYIYLEGE